MALFQITRPVPGWSEDELLASGVRAEACAKTFRGVRWIRSFLDAEDGVLTCIYEAPDVQSIRSHAALAELPCEDVREVSEALPFAVAELELEPAGTV